MKRLFLLLSFFFFITGLVAQDLSKFHLYNPSENAAQAIAQKLKEAKTGGKHVFVQIGGNWCIWCARFNDFVTKDTAIDSLIRSNYVVYHMNYSKENKNEKLLARYLFPQRFGFPVFLVLNEKGELLHIQNSAYLEEGKGYSKEKVVEFFNHWSPRALDPKQYKEN